MDPAPPARKSSLEILLDTLRERDEQRQDDGEHFLPPSPARPRGRGRPPTSVRWALLAGFQVGNGEGAVSGTVIVDKKSDAGKEGATISDDGAAGVVLPAIETVLGDAMSPDPEQEQCIREKGRGVAADPMLSPHGMDELIQEDEDDTVIWINHGCTGIVDGANRQVPESEINVEDEGSLHDVIVVVPGGDDATDMCNVSPSASMSSAGSPSISPPRSSSGSSHEREPERRTKASVGKLLSCVRAPASAVATMVLNSCGSSSARADQGAETNLHHNGTMKSVPSGGGDTDVNAVKASAASASMSRNGGVWRWLKKVSCRLRNARGTEGGDDAAAPATEGPIHAQAANRLKKGAERKIRLVATTV